MEIDRSLAGSRNVKPPSLVIVRWGIRPGSLSRSILADRDGVLVEVAAGRSGVRTSPYAADALGRLKRAGYAVVIVSNQGGVSRGTMTLDAMLATNEAVLSELDPDRALIDYAVICPHSAEDGCVCRKPLTGGVRRLEREVGQRIAEGWFIGDQRCDLECGRTLGLRTALVATGHGISTWSTLPKGDLHIVDLRATTFAEAVRLILP
jgi:histidinol-phosphate phosphatase family protein